MDNSSHNPERVVRGETGAGDFLKLSFQVLLNRSVLSYVATNYIMQMAFVAFGGWLVIYLEHLAPTLDPTVRAVFISCTLWVPFTVSIGLADYAVYVGVFWINYWSFVIRAASGGLAVLVYRAGLIGTIGDDSFNYALLTYLMFQVGVFSLGLVRNVRSALLVRKESGNSVWHINWLSAVGILDFVWYSVKYCILCQLRYLNWQSIVYDNVRIKSVTVTIIPALCTPL